MNRYVSLYENFFSIEQEGQHYYFYDPNNKESILNIDCIYSEKLNPTIKTTVNVEGETYKVKSLIGYNDKELAKDLVKQIKKSYIADFDVNVNRVDKISFEDFKFDFYKSLYNNLNFKNYDFVVSCQSSSPFLNSFIEESIDLFGKPEDKQKFLKDGLFKSTETIKFNYKSKNLKQKTIDTYSKLIDKNKWNMKKINVVHRDLFSNFTKVDSNAEQILKDKPFKVLLVDDVLTSKSTIKDGIRSLQKISFSMEIEALTIFTANKT